VRDPEALARQTLQEVAADRLARREADRVHQPVQAVPVPGQALEGGRDLGVMGHIAVERQLRAELARELADALLEALAHVRERELGTFAPAGTRNAVGDRAVRQHAGDQDALAGQERHGPER